VRQLDRLHAQWLAAGRPGLGDYRMAFAPIDQHAAPPPDGWTVDRRFHRQLIWLEGR
jgi:hypothetical protein